MSHDTQNRAAKLVHMANQIASFFVTQSAQPAPVGTAAHIRKFWDPRMRKTIVAHLDAGGAGLSPAARGAIEIIKQENEKAA
jgi:formate dehydrogenase subunit delta